MAVALIALVVGGNPFSCSIYMTLHLCVVAHLQGLEEDLGGTDA